MIQLDGSAKSGSGTIVRLGLAIAALTRQALEIRNIRSLRPQPGLRPQHLAVLEAMCHLTDGVSEGGEEGSPWLRYTPRTLPQGGRWDWRIPTAGSATLMATSLLPLAFFARHPCDIWITGGIFQDFAPSGHHTQHALVPLLNRMGALLHFEIVRPGYYPKGGGRLHFKTEPTREELSPLQLASPTGGPRRAWGIALSSHLERQEVSARLAESCMDYLHKKKIDISFQIVHDHSAHQPGAALAAFVQEEAGLLMGSDMAGARGRRSEEIGYRTAQRLWRDFSSGATVDRHLADQLILPAALAAGDSEFVIPARTEQVETNIWLVEELLGARVSWKGNRLRIRGIGYRPEQIVPPS